jgi:hypothetical protein
VKSLCPSGGEALEVELGFSLEFSGLSPAKEGDTVPRKTPRMTRKRDARRVK